MTDRDMLQMLRDGKAERDATGTVDERADVVLALYEAGISGWGPNVSTDTLKAWLAKPDSAETGAPRAFGVNVPLATEFKGRRGGEPASNQFGTFEVHQASAKQIAFIKRLLEQKDPGDIKIPADVDTVSKTAASALIDRLMGRPDKATSVGTTSGSVRLASDKQMGFLRKLIAERDYYSLLPADRAKVDFVTGGGVPTSKGASGLIDVLAATAYATRSEQPKGAELESGMYRKGDEIFKVYRAVHGSGRMCAKLLVLHGEGEKATFEYKGLAERFVAASDRMTIEEAKAFGAIYGVCCVCGATLTNEVSIEAGIGPVCGGRV